MNLAFLKRGQTWCAVLAALFIGLGIGNAVESREPVGKIDGKVIFDNLRGKTLEGVEVILTESGHSGRFHTHTNSDGSFTLSHVPEGSYWVSASTHAHRASSSDLAVIENQTTHITLNMERNESDFALKQHQKVYGSTENVKLPMSGYVDGYLPKGQDYITLKVYETHLSRVLKDETAANDFERLGREYDPLFHIPESLRGNPVNAKLIRDENVQITEDDREGFFYKNMSFGKLPHGLYLIQLNHSGHPASTWVAVTDTAIVTKKAGNQLLAFAVEMGSGKPIPNASVQVYRGGKLLTSAQSNSNGLAELKVNADNSGKRLTTVVTRGDDESVVNLNDYYNEGRGDFVVEAYTDRPIYRPGQRIAFKGIARRKEKPQYASPLSANPDADKIAYQYSVPTGQPIDVELRDPSGERVLQGRYTANRYGSFFGQVDLLPEAPTGVYSLIMKVNGETHTHDIVIASYKKPEYQVAVTSEKSRYVRGEPVSAKVKGTYYFGGPLAGAKASYTITRQPDWASYEEPDTDTGEEEFGGESGGQYVESGNVVLDENGEATIPIPLNKKDEDDKTKPADAGYIQTEKYVVSVEVQDQSERFVSAEGSIKVVPGDFRLSVLTVGYVAEPGKPTDLTLVATDYDGKPVANHPVSVQLSYEQWKEEEYVTEKGATINATTDTDGRATVSVTPPKSGYLIFTATASDSHNRTITAMKSLWVVGDAGGDLQTEYSDLSVLTDKKGYKPGETARVLLNASKPNLTILLTVEGDRVAYQQLVTMKGRSTVVRIPMRAEFGPNITLAACYVFHKKIAQSEAALRVAMPDKEISVAIEADRSGTATTQGLGRYQPGEAITYTVKTTDNQGKPVSCEVSFGVVDEAIYALREDSPNTLRNAFYPRRYNQVTTNYSFAIQYLGDADKAEPKISARKKFPDTAYWNPTLVTDANGRATVRFNLPDTLTTWRATATAQTLDTRLGRGVQKVMVNKDFFVRLEKPRFLTVKDESVISAIVHNNTETAQNAQVHLTAEGMQIKEAAQQSAAIEPGKTAEIRWNVTATNAGTQKIRLTAWTPKTGSGQYTDGVENTLLIKPHGRERVTGLSGEITSAPQTEIVRFDPSAAPEHSTVTIRITPSLIGALTDGLDYLVDYPYGCTEQTMSRFLPDLVVGRLMWSNRLAVAKSRDLPNMVRSGLARLTRLQHKDTGAWGWWENDKTDLWMTAYVFTGLGTAKQEGYAISPNLMELVRKGAKHALDTVQENLDRPSSRDSVRANYVTEQEKLRAYLLYGLALLGEKDTVQKYRGKMRVGKMDSEGLAYAILLDKLLGSSASEAFARLDKKLVTESGMMHWKSGENHDALGNGSDLTATAVGLRALLTVNRNDDRIPSIVRWLMYKRTANYWLTTRDTSYVLLALADFLQGSHELNSTGNLAITLNGAPLQTVSLTGDTNKWKEIIVRVPTDKLRRDKNEFRFARDGGTVPVFYTLEARQTLVQDDLPEISNAGIKVKREYLRILAPQKGDSTYKERTEATQNQLTAGDKIRVRLTVTVPQDMAYVLIEDPFPSGCETTERGEAEESSGEDWRFWYDSVDIRDDKIAFFVRSLPKGTHTLEYNLRAQTAGQCGALPTFVQAMYVPELKAESASAHLKIEGGK